MVKVQDSHGDGAVTEEDNESIDDVDAVIGKRFLPNGPFFSFFQ